MNPFVTYDAELYKPYFKFNVYTSWLDKYGEKQYEDIAMRLCTRKDFEEIDAEDIFNDMTADG